MKLIIQIPCYNEAETLEIALNELPKQIEGVDEIEYLVINDGSSDDTEQVALNWGVNYIVHFKRNLGLAKGFLAGIDLALRHGADKKRGGHYCQYGRGQPVLWSGYREIDPADFETGGRYCDRRETDR